MRFMRNDKSLRQRVSDSVAAVRHLSATKLTARCSQFAALHKDTPQISVGFVGYPNVGKSSVINSLAGKKVCKVAPIPVRPKFAVSVSSSVGDLAAQVWGTSHL